MVDIGDGRRWEIIMMMWVAMTNVLFVDDWQGLIQGSIAKDWGGNG